MKKNVILTSGSGYQFYQLQAFIETLFQTDYDGELAFFISDTDETTLHKLREYPILLIPFSYKHPYLPEHPDIAAQIPEDIDFTPHPKTIRYIMYLAFLKARKESYKNVMLSDVRDVIFQKDPFDFSIDGKIYSFLEDKSQKIKDNYYNALWLKEAFGQDTLDRIGENYIVCSGITIGDYHPMVEYLEKLTHYIIYVVKDRGCKDQGIHNYLIYTNQIKNIKLITDDEGAVSTITTHKPASSVMLNDEKNVINKHHQIINIVHQYDRHWQLLWKYNKREYFIKKTDFLKQFFLAVKRAGKLKQSHLNNLQSILFDPIWKKPRWE
ncbi:MAG: hypothetical protein RIG62_31030 [Cyclobacteriaceae bacterium]